MSIVSDDLKVGSYCSLICLWFIIYYVFMLFHRDRCWEPIIIIGLIIITVVNGFVMC